MELIRTCHWMWYCMSYDNLHPRAIYTCQRGMTVLKRTVRKAGCSAKKISYQLWTKTYPQGPTTQGLLNYEPMPENANSKNTAAIYKV